MLRQKRDLNGNPQADFRLTGTLLVSHKILFDSAKVQKQSQNIQFDIMINSNPQGWADSNPTWTEFLLSISTNSESMLFVLGWFRSSDYLTKYVCYRWYYLLRCHEIRTALTYVMRIQATKIGWEWDLNVAGSNSTLIEFWLSARWFESPLCLLWW